MRYVSVDGIRLAFRRAGSGPTLLLLHGAVCDSRIWRGELSALADEFDVIAWDAPGCGASDDPPAHYRMGDFARSLLGFTAALGLQRPHVLGHSWGSTLALEAWRQQPDLPRSLLLAGAYAGWAGSLPAAEVARRLAFALAIADLDAGSWDPTTMPGLFTPAMPAAQRRLAIAVMSEIRPAGTRTMAHALAEADLRDSLQRIAVPTLLLYGEADERAPRYVADALHSVIPGSKLATISGAGHDLFLDNGPACHEQIRSFISSVDTEGPARTRGPISPRGRASPRAP